MSTAVEGRPVKESRFVNSIDYWRRKRGLTWAELAREIGSTWPQLVREAQTIATRHPHGGGLSDAKKTRLTEVLGCELWQMYVPAEDAEKIFGPI